MEAIVMDLFKLCFHLYLWLQITIVCLNSQGCQLPIRPIYGSYHPDGNRLIYKCMKGYGLIGSPYRTCSDSGTWSDPPPFCVQVADPVFDDNVKDLADDNVTTCIGVSPLLGVSISGLEISSKFFINGSFSRATIRVIMTPYLLSSVGHISIDEKICHRKKKYNFGGKFAIYDFNCSLINTDGKIVTITIHRRIAFWICEIQVLLHENAICPLLDLSPGGVNITYEPEVIGNTAIYGTAARYNCNGNQMLQGSEVRYCVHGNQWSGNHSYCKEENEEIPSHIKYFVVIVSSSAAVGFAIIIIVIVICITLRRRTRAKSCSSQDVQLYDTARTRISMIDHYYNTLHDDNIGNSNRTSVTSENGEYDYCTVIETDTGGSPTSWKFEQLAVNKLPRTSVYLIDNESYERS